MGIKVSFSGHGNFKANSDSAVYIHGEDGATFYPSVSENGILSWTNDKSLENPNSVSIVGPKGDKGDKGDRGEPGPQGEPGEPGETGPKGDKGDTGPQGIQGEPGEKGEKGDVGPRGEQGPKGDTGETGLAGKDGISATHFWDGTTLTIVSASGTSSAELKGDKGDQGPRGPQGDTGSQGEIGPQGPKGDKGAQGPKGDKGDTGETGPSGSDGRDGISATHSWNGTTLTITSASGTSSSDLKGAQGLQGIQGEQGEQGPKGDQGPKGEQGPKGDKGDTGETGAPGNGIKSTVLNADYTLTVVFDDGTSYTTPSIRGATGATGAAGKDGTNGTNGKDGISVTVKSTSESTADGGSNTVTFSDDKTITIKNGSKGDTGDKGDSGVYVGTEAPVDPNVIVWVNPDGDADADGIGKIPVKGVDYWTPADQESIVQDVIRALGTPVFGRVDADNSIILTGELVDGTYTIKYEDANGNVKVIGTLTHDGKDEPTYTNQIPIATDTDGSVFNGTGYKSGHRLNSSGAVAEYTTHPMVVSGFIPCKAGDVIRLKNITWQDNVDSKNNQRLACYDANKNYLNQSNVGAMSGLSSTVKDENDVVQQFALTNDGQSFDPTNAAYIRISATYIGEDSILTVNEEIV